MTPLEPRPYVPAGNPSTSAEIPEDENNAAELVEIGLRTAGEELRDAASEDYVDEANTGDDTEEALADLAFTEAAEDLAEEVGPENDAIHLEVPPED